MKNVNPWSHIMFNKIWTTTNTSYTISYTVLNHNFFKSDYFVLPHVLFMPRERNVPGLQLPGKNRCMVPLHISAQILDWKDKSVWRLKEKYEEHNPRRWVCVKVDKSVCWFKVSEWKGSVEWIKTSELIGRQREWLWMWPKALNRQGKKTLWISTTIDGELSWNPADYTEKDFEKASCSSVAWPRL